MKTLLASLLLIGALGATQAAPVIVSFTPSAQHVNVGDFVTIDMTVSGLGDEVLSSFDLNFRYDGSLLNWSSVTFFTSQLGPGWGGMAPMYDFDGTVNGDLAATGYSLEDDASLAAGQANSFLLFRFNLSATADGVSSFGLGADLDFERNFTGLDWQTLDVTVQGACVAIGNGSCANRVPEPTSLALLGIAALGGLWAGRRSRRPD